MDITIIEELIGSIGFPIIVCGFMYKLFRENLDQVQKSLDQNTDAIKEMKTMVQTFMDYMAKMTVMDGEKNNDNI